MGSRSPTTLGAAYTCTSRVCASRMASSETPVCCSGVAMRLSEPAHETESGGET